MKQNLFFKNLPIYFINLERSKDRLDSLLKSFNEYKITEYVRVDAVDATTLTEANIRYLPYHKRFSDPSVGMGHYGCLLSFFKAFNEFLNSPHEYAVFCDDDVDFFNSTKMNFNFYDTLAYHNPKFYNLKTNAIDQKYLRPIYRDVRPATLMKPTHLSYGASTIVNRAWAEHILKRYNALGVTDYKNFIFDATGYTHHYNNTVRDWIIPSSDSISFDEHTYLWVVFSLLPSHNDSVTTDQSNKAKFNRWFQASYSFGEMLKSVDEITIDSFKSFSIK